MRDKLPSNAIYDLKQDNKGYMWIATENGLAKFDGYNFKTFTIDDGLADNYIKKIVISDDNSIWVGSYSGELSVIRNNNIKTIGQNSSNEVGEFLEVFQDSENRVWCITVNGLFYIENDTIMPFLYENKSFQAHILNYNIDNNGNIWLATNNRGVVVIDRNYEVSIIPELSDYTIRDIIQDKQGDFWFASQENGVVHFDGKHYKYFNTNNGLKTDTTLCLLETTAGDIYVGTYNGGISIIHNDSISNIFSNETKHCEIHQLFQDSKERIWVKTQQKGILLIERNQILKLTVSNGLIGNSITSIFEDNNSNLWFGSNENGISVYQNPIFSLYLSEKEVGSNLVSSVKAIKKGNVLIGTDNSLYEIDSLGDVIDLKGNNGLPEEPYIYSIAEGLNNEVWLGTLGGLTKYYNSKFDYVSGSVFHNNWYQIWSNSLAVSAGKVFCATEDGLIIYKDNNYSLLSIEQGLISNDLYSIAVDCTDNIWCGSSEGLSIYNKNEFFNFTEQDGLANNFCNDICFDANGVAWIATDNGVSSAVFEEKKNNFSTRNYTLKDGLASNLILSVVADLDSNIWLGHEKGVDRLNPRTKEVVNYGYLEGFIPLENNLGAIDVDSKGNVWFGTVEGVVRYDPKNDYINQDPPKTYITSVSLYNDTTDITRFYSKIDSTSYLPLDLQLPFSNRALIFEFVGLHYKNVPKNQYKYRLLGYEDTWSASTSEIVSEAYKKLPNGKYTFQVMASNCDGVWTDEPVEFSFRILPPWWKTIWARILEGILLITLLFLIIHLRERKLKHDKKVLTQKVKERTLEVVKQKNQIEIQRDEISRQKQEITDSIQYAEHIQSAILPKDVTISDHLSDYFILFKPRDIVSGDFYWIDKVNNKIIAIAADCTGHGVPGAFMSMLGVSILNQISVSTVELSAHYILNQLREKIISTLSHTRKDEETRDGMDIALSIIDFDRYQVEFAGAYNPLVIVRNGEVEVYKGDKMPVGSMPGEMKPFSSQNINIEKGDCLYMFSDGYADQFGGPDGKKFKTAPFRKLLAEISHKPMVEQMKILNDTIVAWMANEEQIDDILVIGIRI